MQADQYGLAADGYCLMTPGGNGLTLMRGKSCAKLGGGDKYYAVGETSRNWAGLGETHGSADSPARDRRTRRRHTINRRLPLIALMPGPNSAWGAEELVI